MSQTPNSSAVKKNHAEDGIQTHDLNVSTAVESRGMKIV